MKRPRWEKWKIKLKKCKILSREMLSMDFTNFFYTDGYRPHMYLNLI